MRNFDNFRAATRENSGAVPHYWSDAERDAVIYAWACQRPLLVRGEPGSGKSQLAAACAQVLGVKLFKMFVRPRMEATEALYSYDAVRRLAEAQVLSTAMAQQVFASEKERHVFISSKLNPAKFLNKGVLWQAMTNKVLDDVPAIWPRAVVLLDEIDKADVDVPHTLLDVLGERSFSPPYGARVHCVSNWPLVIITSNEERELPPAFIRRCAVLRLAPKSNSQEAFVAWLRERAQRHPELAALFEHCTEAVQSAAEMVWQDRQTYLQRGKIGLAEYLDLLRALVELGDNDPAKTRDLVQYLRPYSLQKFADERPAP